MSTLPFLGVGLSYRWGLNAFLARAPQGVDWLEITPEHFLPLTDDARARLAVLAKRFPLVGHSLELSVGSDAPEPAYRAAVREVADAGGFTWHGDHLCFTHARAMPIRALTPLPFTDEAVEAAVRNIREIQDMLGRPFVLENIAYYFGNPLSRMDEAEFLCRVLEGADCGLLLDLHNLHTNAVNHHFDPYRFLARLPLERVVQIHLAGGASVEGLWLDTHSNCSPDEVWALLEHVAPRCPVRGVNFEMDSNFPPFPRLVAELDHARGILRRHGLKAG